MIANDNISSAVETLTAAGLAADEANRWLKSAPGEGANFVADCGTFSNFWTQSSRLLGILPRPAARQDCERAASRVIQEAARNARVRFLRRHGDAVYDALTDKRSRFVRVEELVVTAARNFPGLVPTPQEIAQEDGCLQSEKAGLEIDQGLLLSGFLGSERSGRHLCHAMLLPRSEARAMLPEFAKENAVRLPGASIARHGKAAIVTFENPRFLNAEDQTTIDAMETGVDLATLDPATEIAVLRGGPVEHPKYQGRHIFGSGINLTHLYRGRIPFVWFIQRELGFVHKLMRGIAGEVLPDDVHGYGIEKPWIAAVDAFAIGGHCQILLTMDYVLAADDAFMTLPARKEGIIPGVSNMRLPRFTGDRLARQLIQYERKLVCDSAEGRLICDEIAPAGEMWSVVTESPSTASTRAPEISSTGAGVAAMPSK